MDIREEEDLENGSITSKNEESNALPNHEKRNDPLPDGDMIFAKKYRPPLPHRKVSH